MDDAPARTARYEIKATCDRILLPYVRSWVRLHPELFVEAYPPRRVNNLYLDSREADCWRDNIVGTGERSKLRLRWYGPTGSEVCGALELKRKSNQLGWKESCAVDLGAGLTQLSWNMVLSEMRRQAEGPPALWLSFADQPVLVNSYRREYYQSLDGQVRVTIDCDQVAFEQITWPAPNLHVMAPVDDQVVVEVKTDAGLRKRASDVLTAFPLQVGRNSKYVNGVLDSLCFA